MSPIASVTTFFEIFGTVLPAALPALLAGIAAIGIALLGRVHLSDRRRAARAAQIAELYRSALVQANASTAAKLTVRTAFMSDLGQGRVQAHLGGIRAKLTRVRAGSNDRALGRRSASALDRTLVGPRTLDETSVPLVKTFPEILARHPPRACARSVGCTKRATSPTSTWPGTARRRRRRESLCERPRSQRARVANSSTS